MAITIPTIIIKASIIINISSIEEKPFTFKSMFFKTVHLGLKSMDLWLKTGDENIQREKVGHQKKAQNQQNLQKNAESMRWKEKIETMEEWQLNEKNDTKIAEWQNQDKKSLLSKT